MENWEFMFFILYKREQLWQIMEKARRESSIRFLGAASLTEQVRLTEEEEK